MNHLVFTGGGTTGHVTKNKIILEELKKSQPDLKCHYLGLKNGKEAELISPDLAEFQPVASGKLRRYFALETIPDFFRFLLGIWQSFWLLGKIKPRLVFSSGGFVALPVTIAAWARRIPILTHETDSYPGLANRIIGKMASRIFLGFECAGRYFNPSKIIYTGNPVSPALSQGSKERALKKLGFSAEKKILLVMGGSQGARQINELVWEILPELMNDWQVAHLTGVGKSVRSSQSAVSSEKSPDCQLPTANCYRAFDYVTTDYADFLAAADLVVSRAGGNSLAEMEALGKSAILIPLPLPAAAGDHQRKNAEEMLKKHPQWKVLDSTQVSGQDLLQAIRNMNLSETKISPVRLNKSVLETILLEINRYL